MHRGKLIIKGYPIIYARYENGHFLKRGRATIIEFLKISKKCYWCGIRVKLYPHIDGVANPKDEATVDHMRSKVNRKKGEWEPRVIACAGCNIERSKLQKKRLIL